MKHEIDTLDATPSKRLFLSIIADYDLNKSICELIDNGIDVWVRGGRKGSVEISITLDLHQQRISVKDNAGGLPRKELSYIVGPGQTGTKPTDETIGLFGVGTKRAVVALAQDVRIKTHYKSETKAYEVDFDEDWIATDDWRLPLYEIDGVARGATIVDLQRLRIPVTEQGIALLKEHLSVTYAKFLTSGAVSIELNGERIVPHFFDAWAYPPKYAPNRYTGNIDTDDGRRVGVDVTAGLSHESSPATGEYGVYFYCNQRLIARALKTLDVGFTRGLAGLPHPKVSLVRVVVSLTGDARDMPWNSSKSDINTNHHIFQAIHGWLVEVVKEYAALSRIWMGEWPEKVFKHQSGSIETHEITDFPNARKTYLPPMPKSRPRYGDVIADKNKALAKKRPWTRGLYEGIVAADLISKQALLEKNRIALIILDSTLEIAFKEYLVNESGQTYSDSKLLNLFRNRKDVEAEVKKYTHIALDTWKKIDYYYRLRNKLIHERVTVGIASSDVSDYRHVVEGVLGQLFALKFKR
ncbi:MAG TPA: ATP-binding protein [Candidatus Limnocylindrales bacterium]|nr:ATP-binding protein [Candidatus Limnocylindrales bacterium]